MKILNISDLETTEVYREFLRVPSLSLGLYNHEIGASVPQKPHTEDEVYLVVSGIGVIEIDGADHDLLIKKTIGELAVRVVSEFQTFVKKSAE